MKVESNFDISEEMYYHNKNFNSCWGERVAISKEGYIKPCIFNKGRKLKSVNNPEIRPTTAKVKHSFFDIIQENIMGKNFLDGFAGSGNIGIEALSRGAEYVVFIDELA